MKITSFTALNPQLITFEITDLVVGLTCNLRGRGVSCVHSKKFRRKGTVCRKRIVEGWYNKMLGDMLAYGSVTVGLPLLSEVVHAYIN